MKPIHVHSCKNFVKQCANIPKYHFIRSLMFTFSNNQNKTFLVVINSIQNPTYT